MRVSSNVPFTKAPLFTLAYQTTLGLLFMASLLFLAAGRVDWPLAWVFLPIWLFTKYIYLFILAKRNPDLLLERSKRHENRKRWDRIIQSINVLFGFIAFIVIGLDAGRYNWGREFPLGLVIVSYVVYLGINLLALWASLSNPFHSDESRIQSDRGQYVISDGPYRYVRHPTYVAGVLMWVTSPFLLGSWWGLIPGGLAALMVILRAAFEDRMLHEELPGYAEYAHKVRYRLMPGVW